MAQHRGLAASLDGPCEHFPEPIPLGAHEVHDHRGWCDRPALLRDQALFSVEESGRSATGEQGPRRLLGPGCRLPPLRPGEEPLEEVEIEGAAIEGQDAAVHPAGQAQARLTQPVPRAHGVGVLEILHEDRFDALGPGEEPAEGPETEHIGVDEGNLVRGCEQHRIEEFEPEGIAGAKPPAVGMAREEILDPFVRRAAIDEGHSRKCGAELFAVRRGERPVVMQREREGLGTLPQQASEAGQGHAHLRTAEQARDGAHRCPVLVLHGGTNDLMHKLLAQRCTLPIGYELLDSRMLPVTLPRTTTFKNRARRLVLWTVLACIAAEIGLRLLDRLRGIRTVSLYDEIVWTGPPFQGLPPPGRRFKLRPSQTFTVPERYGDIAYRINTSGYRDRDHDPRLVRPRVLLLGDSVTFGLGAQQEAIYAAHLEGELRAATNTPWEVINLAIFAYHTGLELEALSEDGLPYRPRVIVTQFYMNDFSTPGTIDPEVRPTLGARLKGLRNKVLFSSNLYRRVYQAAFGLAYRLTHDRRRLEHPEKLNRSEPAARLRYLAERPDANDIPAFRALAAIADLARLNGAAFAVLLTPDEVQLFDPTYDEINTRFAAFCAANGLPLIDVLPRLRGEEAKHRLFLDGVHLTAEGHRLVAEELARELLRRGLLPQNAGPP